MEMSPLVTKPRPVRVGVELQKVNVSAKVFSCGDRVAFRDPLAPSDGAVNQEKGRRPAEEYVEDESRS